MVPKDPVGHRNLLICRQLALDKLDKLRVPDEFASAIDAGRSAVERARIAEPQSFVPLVIASRIAMKLDQPEQAVADLREAMRLGPDAVGPAYDLFSVLQIARADGSDDQAFEALNKVHKKEP